MALRSLALCLVGVSGALFGIAAMQSVEAARKPAARGTTDTAISTPEILMHAGNRVPACVTPQRLDAILADRNPKLEEKFKGIAQLYKTHGERLGVRWDYAFYQMILETNSLKFTGDVRARQNNFAGLGATGGGVPGESFADVSSGVLAQLQHLVAYAGVWVEQPVAKRTRDNQRDIIAKSKKLGRAVRFADLTNRWAADGRYARSIDVLASLFRDGSCAGDAPVTAAASPPRAAAVASPPVQAAPQPRQKGRDLALQAMEEGRQGHATQVNLGAARPLPGDAASSHKRCAVMAASFGGKVTLLIRAEDAGAVTFTALDVDGAAETVMAERYMNVYAKGGRVAGRFASRDEAVAKAYTLCDSGAP